MNVKELKFEPLVKVGLSESGSFGLKLVGQYDIDSLEDSIHYIPTSNDSYAEVSGMNIGKEFHWQRAQVQHFKGSLLLRRLQNGQSILINLLPAELYLESVISSEMNPNSNIEFLKAHAIISRSWLMKMLDLKRDRLNRRNNTKNGRYISWTDIESHLYYDVCADDHCQRYQGISRVNEVARKAVSETRGIVMLDKDEKIVDARFSKCCGGKTELFSSVWQDMDYDYLQSLEDDFCNPYLMSIDEKQKLNNTILNDYDSETKDFFEWEVVVSSSQIRENLNEKFNINIGDILDIIPCKIGDSGRIVELLIEGSFNRIYIGKELMIRKLLSDTHLYSSAFEITKRVVHNEILFLLKGHGWGHGVGLCQIGAAIMAERGYKYKDILDYYYKNIKLQKLY